MPWRAEMAKAAIGRLPIDAVPHPGGDIRCANCNMQIRPKAWKLIFRVGKRYFCRAGCANGDLKGQTSFE